MDYERFDIVVVPFPFTDRAQIKRRPALVLSSYSSFGKKAGHSVMAMITSAKNPPWPLDVPISDQTRAGLPAPSVVRMKIFTLDHRFVLDKCGTLSDKDRKSVTKSLTLLLSI